jgi:hypothetical protein
MVIVGLSKALHVTALTLAAERRKSALVIHHARNMEMPCRRERLSRQELAAER